jgi:hypothetical protein
MNSLKVELSKDDYLVNLQEFSHLQQYTASLVKISGIDKRKSFMYMSKYKQEHIIRGLTDI